MNVKIVDYNPVYQKAIDVMMDSIQSEFSIPITGKTSSHIDKFYNKTGYRFWVAMFADWIVGTIGVKLFGGDKVEIKRMMVGKEFRGSEFNTATLLMQTALDFAKEQKCKYVYLGTMEQFVAAQKFYLKYGFAPVAENKLPEDYLINPMDKLFYKLDLDKC
jgi:RimJ/RimL family protein N-acetyltransferase